MSTKKGQQPHFSPELFEFLRDLAKNNRREWFQANKKRYEEVAKDPALQFISDFGPHLEKISPNFLAIPKAVGGSLFRIHRDTRFSNDKTPYKTHIGIQFRHRDSGDVHAPGFYLHLEPKDVFVGIGVWHPDRESLARIRESIATDPSGWKKARDHRSFKRTYVLSGESLKRAPKGYDPDHPMIEDLRRKDFVGVARLNQKDVVAADFLRRFQSICKDAAPFMQYLCEAVGVLF